MADILAVPVAPENTGFKGLLASLFQRVILSYKTTLIGIAIEAVSVVADNFVNSPNKILTIVGSVIAAALVFIKEKSIAKAP